MNFQDDCESEREDQEPSQPQQQPQGHDIKLSRPANPRYPTMNSTQPPLPPHRPKFATSTPTASTSIPVTTTAFTPQFDQDHLAAAVTAVSASSKLARLPLDTFATSKSPATLPSSGSLARQAESSRSIPPAQPKSRGASRSFIAPSAASGRGPPVLPKGLCLAICSESHHPRPLWHRALC